MAAINLDIGGNTSRLDRDIQKTVNKAYSINLKTKGDQPLGRITGKVNEFNKSLDASNARVIAFGASAGIIFGLQRAFSSLVTSTIEVQKSLQDINVILNVSTTQLNKFGSELFNIAKNTGQSFQEVAGAATEFSRQGLGLVETLKRTNEALILSRLSGLDTVKSVQALTAAVNSFASQAVTATEIVNKFANVDAAFAVSSADLADAISRVGSSAAQSGVSLNELIALVTSAQQTTARGGAVIGNSFKTIFTRLQRGKVVDLLGTLGISDTTAGGEIKSTIQLLQELGKVYDNLGAQQQAYVAEQVGGVFQINILKAALADLGKEYSVYSSALSTAEASTDQAIKRNEQLNKTYAAQLNALQQNAKQLATGVGNRVLGPVFDRVVGGANELLGGVNESDGKGIGAVLGKGILDGLGQLLAGPGLVLIGGILLKLTKDFAKFGLESGKGLLGLNSAATQQKNLQESIGQILQNNPKLIDRALKSEQGLNQVANSLYATLQKQTIELQNQEKISQRIAKAFYGAGVRSSGGVPVVPTSGKSGKPGKAAGFIPNFANAELLAAKEERYTARRSFEVDNPVLGPVTVNDREKTNAVPVGGYPPGTLIVNPRQLGQVAGIPLEPIERMKNKAKGFVPNFASVKDIAKFNKRVSERLSLSQSPRGDGRLQGEDLINLSGRAFQQKQFPKESTESFKKYESRVIQQSKSILGKSYRSGEELRFVSSAAVDGYNISKNGNNTLIDLLEVKGGKNWNPASVLNKFLRAVPENYLSGNSLDVFKKTKDNITVGATLVTPFKKEKAKPTQSKLLRRASGFIPNFAKNITDLGDTVTSPLLKGKVSSLIHPKVTGGQEKRGVTATYLGQQYKGLVTTAGINKQEIKNEIPDLEKNLGNLLVREANQFGQAIGGQNFLQNPEELPNYGAVKGAVGTAFEGGVTTLLQRGLQKSSQIAGIDFTQQRMTPKMKKLFHGAPGTYEAKYSPDLANEVLGKMLKAANVGGVKQVRSGAGYKASQALRAQALKNLQGQNLRRGTQLETAIKAEMARLSRTQGMAAGYIPNFAAQEIADVMALETAMSGQKAIFDTKPFPHVRNKSQPTFGSAMADHGGKKQALKDSLMSQKRAGLASGFIPNFAEDVSAAPIGSTIGALVAQLGILAFFLKDIRTDMATAHTEAIEVATNEITQDKAKLDSLKEGTAEHDKLNKKIKSNTESLKKMDSTASKVASGLMASASTIMIAAPMLAALAKNAIGSETKGARATSAAIEVGGQGIAMTAMAAMLATARKTKGVISVIGTAVTAVTSALGYFKELGTDLPELSRAAEKASQKLSEFENISQQANTSLEQITDLRNKGQAKEAGAVEGKILTDIAKQVTDPNVAAQMQRAIINKDSEALRKAIEDNTKILREERDKTERSAAVSAGIEGIKAQQRLLGGVSERGLEKQISEAKTIFGSQLLNLTTKDASGKEVRSTGVERFNQLQNLGRMNESGGSKEYRQILEDLNFEGEELKALMQNEKAIRPLLQKLINEQIESQAAQLRNTEEGNSVVKQISDAMRNVRSKYDEYAKVITQGIYNQISANSEIKNALARIEVGRLESNAEITEAFTGSGSTATRQAKTGAELAKINSDFTANINEPITEATRTLFDVLQSSVSTKIGTMATPGKDQNSAVMNFETLQASLLPLLESLNIENLQGILPSANEDFQGFDVKKIIDSVRQEVGETPSDDTQKGLENLEKQLNTANSILYEQRRVQQEQKTLLAQQKFTEIAKLFIAGIKESMGGFEGFLKGNFNENSQALQDAASAIRIIGSNPQTREGQIQVGRELGIVTTELSKLSGLNIGEELAKFAPNVIAQIEGGQSKYIEDNLNTIFNSLAGLDEGIAQAFRTSLTKKFDGLGEDASNKEIADATAKAQTQMQYELVPALSDSIRKASIAQLKKEGGEGSQQLIDLLESPASAFLDPQSYTNMALDTSNKLLEQILAAINAPVDASTPATTPTVTPGYGGPAYDSGGAAGGFFPAFANSKESIIPNFKQQYEKEKRDQLKYGYSGGKPLPLSEENFNPLRDAIANPMQMALFGGMKSKSLGAAGGYFPNFAVVSQERINKLLNMARNGTPTEKKNAIAALKRMEKAGKLPPGALSGAQVPSPTKPKTGSRLALPGPAGRPPKPVPLPKPKAFSKAAKAIPYVGAGITAYNAYSDYQENTGQGMDSTEAAVRAALEIGGTTLGGFAGSIGGLGAFSIPVGIAGAVGGNILGKKIGDLIYGVPGDKIDPTANPSIKPPKGPTVKFNNSKRPTKQKNSEKPDKKQLDEIKQAMGPKLPSVDERKAIADREIQAQLIRWQMGASAAFKNYDKDGVSTGIKSMYGQGGGQEVKGSNIDVTRQLTETNRALKASKSPRQSMALARKATALRRKIQSEILPKSEFIGKQGEGMGARTLINEAIAKGQTINAIDPKKPETGRKLSEANLQGLQRTITGKDGEVIGYSRYNPEASKYREYSGAPGVYVDGKLWTPPEERNKLLVGGQGDMPAEQVNLETGESMQVPRAMPVFKMGGAATELGTQIPNPAADSAKLERTKDKEQEEAGVPRSQIYSLDLPEVVTPDNPDGTAVFNKEDERSVEEARKAVKRSFVGGGGKFGGGGASASYAGGYFPNFAAEPSSTSNNINVSVGVNITAAASASSIDKDALSAQIQTLLEVEVPKLNALKARVDRMGEVVTKVQEGNPGKYNLPPKQVPK